MQNKKSLQNILTVGESSQENMENEGEEGVMVEYAQEENYDIEQEEGDIEQDEEDECMEQIKVDYPKVNNS